MGTRQGDPKPALLQTQPQRRLDMKTPALAPALASLDDLGISGSFWKLLSFPCSISSLLFLSNPALWGRSGPQAQCLVESALALGHTQGPEILKGKTKGRFGTWLSRVLGRFPEAQLPLLIGKKKKKERPPLFLHPTPLPSSCRKKCGDCPVTATAQRSHINGRFVSSSLPPQSGNRVQSSGQ